MEMECCKEKHGGASTGSDLCLVAHSWVSVFKGGKCSVKLRAGRVF